MEIKKRIFYTIGLSMLSILIVSYGIMNFYFYRVMFHETVVRQQAYVEINRQMTDSFVQSIYHTAIQIVSSKTIGECLNFDGDDKLKGHQAATTLNAQFSHYSTHQIIDSRYSYKNTLFISDALPVSTMFEPYTLNDNPYNSSNMVFSNINIKHLTWYKKTLEQVYHVFVNKKTDELCIARRLNNNYYSGAYGSKEVAIMVTSVPLSEMDQLLTSFPISPNSGYAILNEDGNFLYCNPTLSNEVYINAWKKYSLQKNPEYTIDLDGKRYLLCHKSANYGINILYLTPTSDIVDSILPLLHTYGLIFAIITLITLLVIYYIAGRTTKPLINMAETISSIQDTQNFDKKSLHVSNDKELLILEDSFNHLIDNVNTLIQDIHIKNENEKRSMLRALQAQINPHFLFNAMDMVNWLALTRNCDDIAQIVSSIADLMRYSITDADSLVPIDLEIANIREFVSIYQLRHRNQLHLKTQTEAGIRIPKFSLQPLVENSIRYAVPPDNEELFISVLSYQEDNDIILKVIDNGTTGNAEILNRYLTDKTFSLKTSSGFGIRNVNERIQLWFGNDSTLTYHTDAEHALIACIVLKNAAKHKNS